MYSSVVVELRSQTLSLQNCRMLLVVWGWGGDLGERLLSGLTVVRGSRGERLQPGLAERLLLGRKSQGERLLRIWGWGGLLGERLLTRLPSQGERPQPGPGECTLLGAEIPKASTGSGFIFGRPGRAPALGAEALGRVPAPTNKQQTTPQTQHNTNEHSDDNDGNYRTTRTRYRRCRRYHLLLLLLLLCQLLLLLLLILSTTANNIRRPLSGALEPSEPPRARWAVFVFACVGQRRFVY